MASLFGENKSTKFFRCPNCKEYISEDSTECKFCLTPVSSETVNLALTHERRETSKENRTVYLKHIGMGALLFVIGTGLTVASFMAAASSQRGGRFSIVYGLIIIGAGDFLYGVYLMISDLRDK
ncbi:MAG: hypothetical protein ABI954_10060 [Pyrinomonadaceae bacterium]